MAETFKNQVDALTGFAGTEDDALTDWLTAGAKELINIFPNNLKEKCTAETTLNHSSTTMDMDGVGEILYVNRLSADSGGSRIPCRKVSSMYGELSNDANSIYKASATDPVYWILSSGDAAILNVIPAPTEDQTAVVYLVGYPTPGHGDTAIANFPDEAEYLVVLYASVKALQRLMNNLNSNTNIDTTAFAAINTELDETQAICDLINTQVDCAVREFAEADTEVDGQIDTACDAITTAAGRINTAVALANVEFDKCDAILDLGEADSETDVTTALTAMNTELDETQAICDLINTQVDSTVTELAKAVTEAGEMITQTDISSDFATALTAINTAVDKFRADGDDPALFGDQNQYTTGEGLTHVKNALELARDAIDTGFTTDEDSGSGDDATPKSVGYWLNDEDTEMAQATLATAQTEISRAQVHISEWSATVQALQAEINGFATEVQSRASFTGAKGQAVQAIVSEASAYLNAAQGYGAEIQSKIAISGGYAQEVQSRLAQAQAKITESNARIASGNAYLQEANASAQEAQTYATEVNARVSQIGGYNQVISGYLSAAQGYASEIQSKIAIAQGYASEANVRMQRDSQKYQWYQGQQTKLQQDYDKGVQMLLGPQPQPQQAGR